MKLKVKQKKAKVEQEVVTGGKSQYANLKEVMDYTRPFEMIYSGVESEGYFNTLYDMGIRSFLMSYHYLQSTHTNFQKRFEGIDIRLFIDSGAYTYISDPKYSEVSVEQWEEHVKKYLRWAEKNKDYIFAIANCDFEILVGAEVVDRWNKEYFEPFMLRTGIPVCFVWHEESYNTWEYYCQRYPYCGFSTASGMTGGSIDLNAFKTKLRIAEKYDSLIHGFGMTRTGMLTELPFYTSDSTTWLVGLQYGEINYWTGKKMTRLKKDVWKTKYLREICDKYHLNEEALENEDSTEMIKANVGAFIGAQDFIQTRLKGMMYWLKAKTKKIDIDNLPEDFFPDPRFVGDPNYTIDVKAYAEKMNINPEYENAEDELANMTMFLNWNNPAYEEYKDFYLAEDGKVINEMHDFYINRIVPDLETKIEDIINFYRECLSGENDRLLQLGTNFDRMVRERDNYIEEAETETVDVEVEEVRERVRSVLQSENLLSDGTEDIDSLDDEIYKKANILPIRDEKGRLVKGQTTKRLSKKVYSDKYPKFACDTCLAASNCPEYKSGYVCAYNKMLNRFKTRNLDDLIDLMQGMVEHNVARMQMAMMQEMMSGAVGDPVVTNFINQNMNLVNSLLKLRETQNTTLIRQTRSYNADGSMQEMTEMTNPQRGGILEKLFGSPQTETTPKNDDIIEVSDTSEEENDTKS